MLRKVANRYVYLRVYTPLYETKVRLPDEAKLNVPCLHTNRFISIIFPFFNVFNIIRLCNLYEL